MKQINIPLSSPFTKETAKEVSNLLSKTQNISWNDLRGLSWILFDEEMQ